MAGHRNKEPEIVNDVEIRIEGSFFNLLPERGVWWKEQSALLLADLHWGKDATFRAEGIPLPKGMLVEELARFSRLVRRYEPDHVFILGDLIHSAFSVDREIADTIRNWRRQVKADILLIEGNHDRHVLEFPDSWRISRHAEPFTIGKFALAHHPEPRPGYFTWCGHLHPTYTLREGKQQVRLPCFQITDSVGVLPAFSEFTAGRLLEVKENASRIYLVADENVIPLVE